jgi:hypothetical protein
MGSGVRDGPARRRESPLTTAVGGHQAFEETRCRSSTAEAMAAASLDTSALPAPQVPATRRRHGAPVRPQARPVIQGGTVVHCGIQKLPLRAQAHPSCASECSREGAAAHHHGPTPRARAPALRHAITASDCLAGVGDGCAIAASRCSCAAAPRCCRVSAAPCSRASAAGSAPPGRRRQ